MMPMAIANTKKRSMQTTSSQHVVLSDTKILLYVPSVVLQFTPEMKCPCFLTHSLTGCVRSAAWPTHLSASTSIISSQMHPTPTANMMDIQATKSVKLVVNYLSQETPLQRSATISKTASAQDAGQKNLRLQHQTLAQLQSLTQAPQPSPTLARPLKLTQALLRTHPLNRQPHQSQQPTL